MLNKYIIGELFEIAQEYIDGKLEFEQKEMVKEKLLYKQITLFAENCKLTILCNKKNEYLITVIVRSKDYIDFLDCLSENRASHLLYSLKRIYDDCAGYPNAFGNALIRMCQINEQMKEQE